MSPKRRTWHFSGQIDSIYLEPGSAIKKGQTIAVLAQPELRTSIQQLEATVADLKAKNPPQLEVHILTRREAYAPAVKLWSWKPAEAPAQWKPKYDTSVFVKSRAAM